MSTGKAVMQAQLGVLIAVTREFFSSSVLQANTNLLLDQRVVVRGSSESL